MLFNSLEFLIFFPVVVVVFFSIPHAARWLWLLAASCFFYMWWEPAYIVLLLVSTLIDYGAGMALNRTADPGRRRMLLLLSLVTNFGLLFFFKYYNFFASEFRQAAGFLGLESVLPASSFLLPVGISFYTFQTVSYTIDVYRRALPVEKRFGIFSLYVSFFPQLVAGPIERCRNLLPQFDRTARFDYVRLREGLQLMMWGMFKKVVIADRLAPAVNAVYSAPQDFQGPALALATVFFAFQIYCDFSGYSDIAVGAARVLGFDLMKNFDRPYFSRSVGEFWSRWHISLSTWFRDYVYIPLGGNRVSVHRLHFNLMVTFFLSGLWHGANWTFVVWGCLNGVYMIASRLTRPLRETLAARSGLTEFPRVHEGFRIGLTFALVCLAWVFFRAPSIPAALTILGRLPMGWTNLVPCDYASFLSGIGMPAGELAVSLAALAALLIVDACQSSDRLDTILTRKPSWVRWLFGYAVLFGLLLFGIFTEQEFIYFQF